MGLIYQMIFKIKLNKTYIYDNFNIKTIIIDNI